MAPPHLFEDADRTKAGRGLDKGQHGLDALADDEDVLMRGQPDGIAEEVTHSPTRCLNRRLALSVRSQPSAMHALQGPCPIGDCSDQRRSGEAPGLALIPMPALRVEAERAHRTALGQAPRAEVGVSERACDRREAMLESVSTDIDRRQEELRQAQIAVEATYQLMRASTDDGPPPATETPTVSGVAPE